MINPGSKRNVFAQMLSSLIEQSDKTQVQISRDMGYENQNLITMFKRGTTRVPLEKVAPMAKSLNQDPGRMIRLWFEAYMSEAVPDLDRYIGMPLSTSEKSWIYGLRDTFGVVPPYDARVKTPLLEVLGKA